jgi:hypothetical protein
LAEKDFVWEGVEVVEIEGCGASEVEEFVSCSVEDVVEPCLFPDCFVEVDRLLVFL